MTGILAEVRRLNGGVGAVSKPATVAAEAVPQMGPARGLRRSGTADILAAARKQGAAGAVTSGVPAQPASRPGGPSRTSDILAAARKQGGAPLANGTAAPDGSAPRPKAVPRAVEAETASGLNPPTVGAFEVRPKSAKEILAAVRADVASGLSRDAAVLPAVAEMVSALRTLDARRNAIHRSRSAPTGWVSKLRRWFLDDRDTHRGASI